MDIFILLGSIILFKQSKYIPNRLRWRNDNIIVHVLGTEKWSKWRERLETLNV